MPSTADVLKRVFQVLCTEQDGAWIRQDPMLKPQPQAQETFSQVSGTWVPIAEKEIAQWQATSGAFHLDLSRRNKVLYLRPLEEEPDFVPILSLVYHFDQQRTEAKLRIVFVRREGDNPKPYCIGLRFELGKGRHSPGHAQFITNLQGISSRSSRRPPAKCPIALPEEQPILPITANCPITLLLCLLLSLYGREYCWNLWTHHAIPTLKTHLDMLDSWTGEGFGRRHRRGQ